MNRNQILNEIYGLIDSLKNGEALDKRTRLGDLLKLLKYKDEAVVAVVFKEYLLAFGAQYSEDEQPSEAKQTSLNEWSELLKLTFYLFSID